MRCHSDLAMTKQLRSHSRLFIYLALLALGAGRSLIAAGDARTPWSMSGSGLGFVFDPQARGLRPVLGVPGASTLGKTVALNVDLAEAIVAPARDHALAITRGSELVEVRQLSTAPAVRPVFHATSFVDAIRLSPMGGEAILYRRAANTYQLLANLPGAPVAGEEFDLPLHGSLTAMALADGCRAALAGFSDGESGAIYLLGSNGQAALISSVRHPSSITFLSHSHDALVVDGAADKIYLLRNVTGNVATLLIADKRDGVNGPVAAEASRDGKRIFVANARSKTILSVELADDSHVLYPCHFVPTTLSHLKGNALYRITEPSTKGPMWLFDGDAAQPRTVFVPAYYAGSNQEKQ